MSENTSPNPEPEKIIPPVPATMQPLSDETPEAFEAFLLYFESAQKLSHAQIAQALDVHPKTVSNWSAKFQWRHRILQRHAQLLSYKQRAEAALKEQEALSQVELARMAREHKLRTFRKLDAVADTLLDNYMVDGAKKIRLGEITQLYGLSNRICSTFDPKSKTPSPITDPQLKAAEEQYLADVAQAYKIAEEMESRKEEPPKEEPPKKERPQDTPSKEEPPKNL